MDFTEVLKPGLTAELSETVTAKNAASGLGSGGLPVYGTPSMILLMEMTSFAVVADFLPPGWSTVGTEVNIKHLAATPLGMKVRAHAELLSVDGRALSFKVEAFDETGRKIGEGTHSRFIIDNERFMAKTATIKSA